MVKPQADKGSVIQAHQTNISNVADSIPSYPLSRIFLVLQLTNPKQQNPSSDTSKPYNIIASIAAMHFRTQILIHWWSNDFDINTSSKSNRISTCQTVDKHVK